MQLAQVAAFSCTCHCSQQNYVTFWHGSRLFNGSKAPKARQVLILNSLVFRIPDGNDSVNTCFMDRGRQSSPGESLTFSKDKTCVTLVGGMEEPVLLVRAEDDTLQNGRDMSWNKVIEVF